MLRGRFRADDLVRSDGGRMGEPSIDRGREGTSVQDLLAALDGGESLLNELSGVFEEPGPPNPPKPPAAAVPDGPAITPEETPVASPPRIEPLAMIWKPSRRARFRLRRR
jgi:hypothetical protein